MTVPIFICLVLMCITSVSSFLVRRADGVYQISGFGRSYTGEANINGYKISSKSIVTSGLCWQETTLNKENPDRNLAEGSSCADRKNAKDPLQSKSNAEKEALCTHNEPSSEGSQTSKDWQQALASEIDQVISNARKKIRSSVKLKGPQNLMKSIKPTLRILSSKERGDRVPQLYSSTESVLSPKTKIQNARKSRELLSETFSPTFPQYSAYDEEYYEDAIDKSESDVCMYDNTDYGY